MKINIRYLIAGLLIVILFLLPLISSYYTDYLWFVDLGYEQVFVYQIVIKLILFLAGTLAAFLFLYLNVRPSFREAAPVEVIPFTTAERVVSIFRPAFRRAFRLIFTLVSAVISLGFGASAAGGWQTAALFLNSAKTGIDVPVFHKDLSFFLFELPFYRSAADWVFALILAAVVVSSVAYFFRSIAQPLRTFLQTFTSFRTHFFGLFASLAAVEGIRLYLASFERAYSRYGAVFGPSYVDVAYLIPALKVFAVASLILAGLLLMTAAGRLRPGFSGFLAAAFLLLLFLGGYIVPAAIQAYVVAPNEFKLERQYIENHIKMTRQAYMLDMFEVIEFNNVKRTVDFEDIIRSEETVENIRLWDARPLKQTYNQLQTIRSYYFFNDIDIDRYVINGKIRQVAVAARELSIDNHPERARTWINTHLKYTHGYGLAVNFVNEVSAEGLPEFVVRDLPVESAYDVMRVERPQIYFGELTDNYVIVNTLEDEFDYPAGNTNVSSRYEGEHGVQLDSYFKKMMFAYRFGTLKILLSNEITPESRVLFIRDISERVRKIAPFLYFDSDPYPVIADGKILWIIDAYTASSRYPYAEPFNSRGENYLRNSVKIVIDAYTGETTFYAWDDSDPILGAYARVFPDLFTPAETIPTAVREHFRYPSDYFSLQADFLASYHMTDPQVFYNQEDRWEFGQEVYADETIPVEPYYSVVDVQEGALKGRGPQFILMLPFRPRNKDNLIAWMFVTSNKENYGEGGVFVFPKGSLIYGTLQIESRIDQDPVISEQITLWNQSGSRVIRGNLLVIPVEDTLLYVEPVYLQAEQSSIPELKRVIVADQKKVIMSDSLEKALLALTGREELAAEETKGEVSPAIITGLRQLFADMEDALKSGDLVRFGQLFERALELLQTTSTAQP